MNDMMHLSDNISEFSVCRPCSPSEGVRKTQENARLRKVGKVRWTGKCGDRRLSWQCCICPPSEGVRKMRETAHLRKVEQKVGRKRWRQGRGLAVIVIVGALLLCIGYFQAGAVSVQALEKYGMRQSEVISGVVVEAGSGTPVAGAVVLYVPAGQEGTEYALSDVQGRFELQVSGMPAAGDSVRVSMLGPWSLTGIASRTGRTSGWSCNRRP